VYAQEYAQVSIDVCFAYICMSERSEDV